MASPLSKNAVLRAAVLFFWALAACKSPTATKSHPYAGVRALDLKPTDFQAEAAPMNKRLHDKAHGNPNLPPNMIIIGALKSEDGLQTNLTYIPSELRVPRANLPVKVAWISWDGPVTLTFNGPASTGPWPFEETPGNGGVVTLTSGNPNWATLTLAKPPAPPAPGQPAMRYHFRVKLKVTNDDGTTQDLEDQDCPPIIVE